MQTQTISIGQFQTGGPVGQHPAMLIGTLFVENIGLLDKKGAFRFEEGKVQAHIDCHTRDCRPGGVPILIDFFSKSEAAILNQVEFVITETDFPFLVSGLDTRTRLHCLHHVAGLGALDRAVYTSLTLDTSNAEIDGLAKTPPCCINVDLGCHATIETALADVDVIKSRLPAEFHHLILLQFGFSAGVSLKTTCEVGQQLRFETGHPIACSPYTGIRERNKLNPRGSEAYLSAFAAVLGFCTAFGFDLLHIGPLRHLIPLSRAQCAVDLYSQRSEFPRLKER